MIIRWTQLALVACVGMFLSLGCSETGGGADTLAPIDAPVVDTSPTPDAPGDVAVTCPTEPYSPEGDPCTRCACDDDGVLTCTAKAVDSPCALADCCTITAACATCEGENCPESGLTCQATLTEDCDDKTICTVDIAKCEAGTCQCTHEPAANGVACVADPHACTVGDECQEGVCKAGNPADMEDGNPCTAGLCVKGVVEQKPLTGPCNDGDECTTGDQCILGQCVPDALVECPEYACVSASYCDSAVGECVVQFVADGAPCDGDDLCAVNTTCQAGECLTAEVKSCDDDNPCTADVCDPDTGSCASTVLPDGSSCGAVEGCLGTQTCVSGVCTASGNANCDDGDPCTVDYCDNDTGQCATKPGNEGTACTLDDLCTEKAACSAEGVCVAQKEKTCNDNNVCTVDSCDPATGCVWTSIDGCENETPDCSKASAQLTGQNCLQVLGPVPLPGEALTIEFWIRVDSYDAGPEYFAAILDNLQGNTLKEPGVMVSLHVQGVWAKSIHYQEPYPSFNEDGTQNGKAHGLLTLDKFEEEIWYHYAAVHDVGGKVRIYINGQLQNSISWNDAYDSMTNEDDLYIGCRDATQWFLKGHIDEMRISTVARYTAEGYNPIDTVFTADPDTLALYRFDAVSISDLNLPIAWDHSGNGYHAHWLGEPLLGEPASLIGCAD
jgi:hypothetical protein